MSKEKKLCDTLNIEDTLPFGSIHLTKYLFPKKWENLSQIDDQSSKFNIDNISSRGYDSIYYFIEKNATLFHEGLIINKNISFNPAEKIVSEIGLKSHDIRIDSAYFVRTIAKNGNYFTKIYKNGNKYKSELIGDGIEESYNYLLLVTTDLKNKPIDYQVIYFSNNRFEHYSRFFYIDKRLNIYTKDFFTDEIDTRFLKSNKIIISETGLFSDNNDLKTNSTKSLNKNNVQETPELSGSYTITTDAISNYDHTKIKLEYYLEFESNTKSILSTGADQIQDYGCEGEYKLSNEDGILHGRGICDQDDLDDFYIKKENDQLYIKSRRFLNKDWQKLSKSK